MQPVRHIALRKQHPRRGFTLVELLVVIVIIGILATLLITAVSGAMKKARETQVVAEMSGIDSALVQFQQRFGQNVPSFVVLYEMGEDPDNDAGTPPPDQSWGADVTTGLPAPPGIDSYRRTSRAFIRQVWPEFDFAYRAAGGSVNLNGDGDSTDVLILNGTECLVFFLGGVFRRGSTNGDLVDDVQVGFAANPQYPFDPTSTNNRVGPYVTFDNARYTDIDNDDVPEYKDQLPSQLRPYIYCSSYDGRGYQPYGLDKTLATLADNEIPDDGTNLLIGDLYQEDNNNPTPGNVGPYLNPNTYQLISPGGDDFEFGLGGEFNGQNAPTVNQRDNITNFKGGRLN